MAFRNTYVNWLSLILMAMLRGFFGLQFREIPNDPAEIAEILPEHKLPRHKIFLWDEDAEYSSASTDELFIISRSDLFENRT